MSITAQMVNELRQQTGAGIMDCKRALTETDGNVDKAVTYLREKGIASATKKATRVAAEGMIETYVHMGGKIGVMVEINCETDFVARGDAFQEFCHEIALQIAAASPQYVRREEVPESLLESERSIFKKQALESGKPEKVVDKIVEGRISKFYAEICLLEQPYVRENKMSIEDLRKDIISKTGENVVIRRFARFHLGEGLEKKSNDLAAEVQAQLEASK